MIDGLLAFLPHGDVAYTREPDGTWGVAIYAAGTAERLQTLATGMDKSIALWMARELREAREP